MNFTREPIIETIITPKEGYKLIVRSSKASGREEYTVDAIEVVSFGHSFFFRSLERPKSFLVPVSDFEVVEAKETRVVLKNASFDRSIKIGGGKGSKEKAAETTEEPAEVEQRLEKKRERKRHRRRRSGSGSDKEEQPEQRPEAEAAEGGGSDDEAKPSSSPVGKLIPPPPGLISDKLTKEKPEASQEAEGNVLPEQPVEEPKAEPEAKEEKPKAKRTRRKKAAKPAQTQEETAEAPKEEAPEAKKEETPPPEAEGGEVQRVAQEPLEAVTSTSFSSVEGSYEPPPFGKIW